jgi:hypothetical protein
MMKFLQEKATEAIKQKEENMKKPMPEEQDGMPQRQHCPPAKRRAKIVSQSNMKSSRKTLHEFWPHIPQKRRKGACVIRQSKCCIRT